MVFTDRFQAGRLLAEKLFPMRITFADPLVISLPRGGIEVGYEIANALSVPHTVFIVRKIGAPGNPEFALSALAETGFLLMGEYASEFQSHVEKMRSTEEKRIAHYKSVFRRGEDIPPTEGRTVIICDDGVATGLTFKCAVLAIRQRRPKEIISALPVAPKEVAEEISKIVDVAVILDTPAVFFAVSQFYERFHEESDSFYRKLLNLEDG